MRYGALIAFYGFLVGVSDPARKLSGVFTQIQSSLAAADRVYELLDTEPLYTRVTQEIVAEYGKVFDWQGKEIEP